MPLFNPPLTIAENVLPVQVVTRIVIFVRTTGNDITGNGQSIATAYATVQHALYTIPIFIPFDTLYVIDCTGVNEANAVNIPTFQNNRELRFSVSPDFVGFYDFPITIQAIPIAATGVPVADTLIAAGEITGQSADAISLLESITTTKVWPVNIFRGKFLVDAVGHVVAIGSNTVDTLETCYGFGALTAPLKIMEPGASISGSGGKSLIVNGANASLAVNGVKCVNNGTGYGLDLFSCQNFLSIMFDGGTRFVLNPSSNVFFFGAVLRTRLRTETGHPRFSSTFLDVVTDQNNGADGLGAILEFNGFISDGAGIYQGSGDIFNVALALKRGDIRGSALSGVIIQGGSSSRNVLFNLKIHGNTQNGVTVGGNPGKTTTNLSTVRGVGNGLIGLQVTGLFDAVVVDASTDVTGAGGDLKVGSLAVRTWANFRAVGPTQFIEYDLGNLTGKTQAIVKQ